MANLLNVVLTTRKRFKMSEKASKPMANFFYEQCAGSSNGHMSEIPNSPVLFGLIGAHSGRMESTYSATKTEFAEFLRSVADQLTS